MKRFFFSCCMLLLAATAANAYDFTLNGIKYATFTSSGSTQLEITGLDASYTGNIRITFGPVSYTYSGTRYNHDCTRVAAGVKFTGDTRIISVNCSLSNIDNISNACFQNCTNLTVVNLANVNNSQFKIGDYAFSGCAKLATVYLPAKMYMIADHAFYGCAMSSITFYDVKTIGPDAFTNNSKLTTINYYNTIDELTKNATTSEMPFYRLRNQITSITVGTNATTSVFYGMTALKSLKFESSVTAVGANAFGGCTALTTWSGGENIVTYKERAFYGCTSLNRAVLLTAVSSTYNNYDIYPRAFANTKITTLVVGTPETESNSTLYLGDYAFENCSSMAFITLYAKVSDLISNPVNAFSGCTGVTDLRWECDVAYNPNESDFAYTGSFLSKLTNLRTVIINRRNRIYRHEFYNLTNLANVYIGDRVTYVSENAFYGCTALTFVSWNVSGDRNNYGGSDLSPFAGSPLGTVVFGSNVTHIPANLFAGQRQLSTIKTGTSFNTLPDGLKTIGAFAFYGVPITRITLPSGLVSIGSGAFYGSKMSSITIPETLTSIGEQAFVSNEGTMSIEWNARRCKFDYGNKMDGWGVFYPGNSNRSIHYIRFGNEVEALPARLCFSATLLKDITLPASLKSIGDSAFYDCSNLNRITCNAVVPPFLWGTHAFQGVNKNDPKGLKGVTLIVPEGSLASYKTAKGWKDFFDDNEGIEEIMASDESSTKVRKVFDPETGAVYILRDGKAYNLQGTEVQ